MLEPLQELERPPLLGYYVQDFEPYFAPGSREFDEARFSYTRIADFIRFTKTDWNREEVYRQIGLDCQVIGPSVNIDVFRPRARSLPRKPGVARVAAMIRPCSPYREPGLTMRVLQEVYARHPGAVDFMVFGCNTDDPEFLALPRKFPWRNHGVLNRHQLSWLLNEADVFVDFSSHQAMGLAAMEAMACGATVVVPRSGGSGMFVEDGSNGLIVDTRSPSDCVDAVGRLVADEALRDRLQRNAMKDICRFFPEQAAFNILDLFFSRSRNRS